MAGTPWSTQLDYDDVDKRLRERGSDVSKPLRRAPGDEGCHHIDNADVIFDAGQVGIFVVRGVDLAFHILALTLADEVWARISATSCRARIICDLAGFSASQHRCLRLHAAPNEDHGACRAASRRLTLRPQFVKCSVRPEALLNSVFS